MVRPPRPLERQREQDQGGEILDRAVSRFPDNAKVFVKRGQAMLSDPTTARDALADFSKALQLSPDLWQAR